MMTPTNLRDKLSAALLMEGTFLSFKRENVADEATQDKLLSPQEDSFEDDDNERDFTKTTGQRRLLKWKVGTAVSSSLVVIFGIALLIQWRNKGPPDHVPTIFSPAESDSEYEIVKFHNNFWEDRTPYQGPPTDEVDQAWDDLYKDIGVIRIDGSDAKKLVMPTLPIPGEDDQYIVGIEVFHQLHCLNSIRKSFYPERYNITHSKTAKQKAEYQVHIEHCIDNIRQAIQCNSDISTIAWIMNPRHHRPAPDAHTTHVCRNFNKLQEWVRERAFTQKEYDIKLAAQSP